MAWEITGNAGTNPSANFIGTSDSQPLVVRTNNAECVRISASGRVGIGTASPEAPLHVRGAIQSGGGPKGYLRLVATDEKNSSIGFGTDHLFLNGSNGTFGAFDSSGRLGLGTTTPAKTLHVVGAVQVNGPLDVLFGDFKASDNACLATRLGNVGIGTDSPQHKLHVEGNARVTSGLVVDGSLNVGRTSLANNVLLFAHSTSGIYTVCLNAEESMLSFAHPVTAGYTILLDGRNNKLSVGGILLNGSVGDITAPAGLKAAGVSVGTQGVNAGPQETCVHYACEYETVGVNNVGYNLRLQSPRAIFFHSGMPKNVGPAGGAPFAVYEAPRLSILADGNVTIGSPDEPALLRVEGSVEATGDVLLAGQDCAEEFEVSGTGPVEPGMVMVFDGEGALQPGTQAYDRRVAGVISGAGDLRPALRLGSKSKKEGTMPLALVGKVYCMVDARFGAVEVGDLLTTSSTPGHAMKAGDPARAFGAVIGKALRPLPAGSGLIPIIVALQ